ncbi:MAG: 3-deoxy-7-phosphoheptulonate synthase [Leptospiraceae bacterium]|nr:3-deoxy-7-phosphoheptulonate synthase [Leptospiraceae bacterium]
MSATQNIHIQSFERLRPATELLSSLPASDAISTLVRESRQTIARILSGEDPRFMVICGPCSIHDEKAAFEYAERFAALSRELGDRLFPVMRVYFEKPRTTVGWKGLINDPHLDGTYDINTGLEKARSILLKILEYGLPTATEFLDPFVPQYIGDLVCYAAIGARTTESQTHREMASGLSMPVGFKNNTDGNAQVAVEAVQSAANPHSFLGVDENGMISVVRTTGNPYCHIILRGGRNKPNYDSASVAEVIQALTKSGSKNHIIVDCSHANSGKQHGKQEIALQEIVEQRKTGNNMLAGIMLESHLFEGNQKIPENIADLKYGVSITDACVDFPTTERLLRDAHANLGALTASV